MILIVTPFMIPHIYLINVRMTYLICVLTCVMIHLIIVVDCLEYKVSIFRVYLWVACKDKGMVTFEVFCLFNNSLWHDDTFSNDETLFLEDKCKFIGRYGVQREYDVCSTIILSFLSVSILYQVLNALESIGEPSH